MPLQRRLPKFGFKNINRVEYLGINIDTLQNLVDNGKVSDTIDMEVLMANGIAHKNDLIKILGRGELKAKLNVIAHKFTASAKEAIEKVGGSVQELN
jgi:large subunit ribosomal protein L15